MSSVIPLPVQRPALGEAAFIPHVEADVKGSFVTFITPEGDYVPLSVSVMWSPERPGVPLVKVEAGTGLEVDVEVDR